jgi:hypothetical protein
MQQQPEVVVQVQALPTPTPTSRTGSIPLAGFAAASILPSGPVADNAVSDGSTFVMPGGPSVTARGSKQQQQQPTGAAAAATREHRGAGVVIDDEAWRQQSAGQGVASAGEQQGQRQVWRPSLHH